MVRRRPNPKCANRVNPVALAEVATNAAGANSARNEVVSARAVSAATDSVANSALRNKEVSAASASPSAVIVRTSSGTIARNNSVAIDQHLPVVIVHSTTAHDPGRDARTIARSNRAGITDHRKRSTRPENRIMPS